MHGELVYPTCLGSADIDVLELVLGGDLAFAKLGDFGTNVTEFFRHFASGILVNLDDLQFNFGNFSCDLCLCGNELTALTSSPAASR